MTPFEIVGYLLIPGDAIPALLQLRHVLRTKTTAGLSSFTSVQWMVSWWLWAAYAILIDSLPLLIVSVCAAALDTAMVVLLARQGKISRRLLWLTVIFAVLLLLAGVTVSPEVIAAVVTVVDFFALAPQLWAALKQADLSGLSIPSWALALFQDVGWVVYGFGIGHPLLALWSLVSAPAGVAILVLAVRKRGRTPCGRLEKEDLHADPSYGSVKL